MTRDDVELYVMGQYDGDVAALEAELGRDDGLCAAAAEEARFEMLLRDAAAAAAFCPACSDVVRDTRCANCGAAVRAGGYAIEAVLVHNAHGRMYRAHDADGTVVALKELAFVRQPGIDAFAAFEREAKLLRALDHAAIPRFVAAFEEGTGVNTRYYLAQELVAGVSLEARLADHWFDERELVAIGRQVLGVLVYLQGLAPMVVHRDIKPANLIQRGDGTIAVVDFGAAHVSSGTTTAATTSIGTFGYMPVEQMVGQVDATTDPYALGASLLHLATRREPWRLLQATAWDELNVSPALRDYLHKLVAPEPQGRFASAAAALAGLAALDQPAPRARARVPRWTRRVAYAAAAAFVVGGVGVAGYELGSRHEPAPEWHGTGGATRAAALLAKLDAIPPQLPRGALIDLDDVGDDHDGLLVRLANICGFNLVAPNGLGVHGGLRLTQVPCNEAFEVALETNHLWYAYDPDANLVRVAPRVVIDRDAETAAARAKRAAQLPARDPLPSGEPIDVDFKDAPLATVLDMVTMAGKVKLVLPPDASGTVTLKVKNVPWQRLLEAVLVSNGLWYRYRADSRILRIAPAVELDREDDTELSRRGSAAEDPLAHPTVATALALRRRGGDPAAVRDELRAIDATERDYPIALYWIAVVSINELRDWDAARTAIAELEPIAGDVPSPWLVPWLLVREAQIAEHDGRATDARALWVKAKAETYRDAEYTTMLDQAVKRYGL
jgi:hypothetical protein